VSSEALVYEDDDEADDVALLGHAGDRGTSHGGELGAASTDPAPALAPQRPRFGMIAKIWPQAAGNLVTTLASVYFVGIYIDFDERSNMESFATILQYEYLITTALGVFLSWQPTLNAWTKRWLLTGSLIRAVASFTVGVLYINGTIPANDVAVLGVNFVFGTLGGLLFTCSYSSVRAGELRRLGMVPRTLPFCVRGRVRVRGRGRGRGHTDCPGPYPVLNRLASSANLGMQRLVVGHYAGPGPVSHRAGQGGGSGHRQRLVRARLGPEVTRLARVCVGASFQPPAARGANLPRCCSINHALRFARVLLPGAGTTWR